MGPILVFHPILRKGFSRISWGEAGMREKGTAVLKRKEQLAYERVGKRPN